MNTSQKLQLILFSICIFLSAFLLFSIQPMFTKMLMPLLGGAPQVWNIAMLFFQALLLFGYLFTYLITKYMSVKLHRSLYIVLFILFFFIAPFEIPDEQNIDYLKTPILSQLLIMFKVIGGPFFILSSSAPILQYWFSITKHKKANNPYFLYAASNLGSLIALVSYPFLIEFFFDLNIQIILWKYMYAILLVLLFGIQYIVSFSQDNEDKTRPETVDSSLSIPWSIKLKWLFIAFLSTTLMLSITTNLTHQLSVPLIWIIPLIIYLLAFVMGFSDKLRLSKSSMINYFNYVTISFVFLIIIKELSVLNGLIELITYIILVFYCVHYLADIKPVKKHLTSFYLYISIGGVLGGICNVFLIPNLFLFPHEYLFALLLCILLFFTNNKENKSFNIYHILLAIVVLSIIIYSNYIQISLINWVLATICVFCLILITNRRWLFGIIAFCVFIFYSNNGLWDLINRDHIYVNRNFFGISKILEFDKVRYFVHGSTIHGIQDFRTNILKPNSYYYDSSPISDAFKYLDNQKGSQKIAVLGLGIGTTNYFQKENRTFDYFEIDPNVIHIAENPSYFTYLSIDKSSYTIYQGDARLQIKNQLNEKYDMILADAFSSDNIPYHIITSEAAEIYYKKLKKNGILVFNISNTYINLVPVLKQLADHMNVSIYSKIHEQQKKDSLSVNFDSQVVVLTNNSKAISYFESSNWTPELVKSNHRLWTDNYSSILGLLKFFSN